MKLILSLIIPFLIATGMQAQHISPSQVRQNLNNPVGLDVHFRTIDINEKSLAFGLTEAEFNTIKHEAYPNPGFVPGIVYHDNKPVKTNVPMRYNAYADEIEIKNSPTVEEYGALVKDPTIFVKIGSHFYVFVPFEDSNEKGGYFNVLEEGKRYQLYKKVTAIFKEGQKAKSSYQKSTPPSFVKTSTYYLVDMGTFLQLPNGKQNIQKAFLEINPKIKTYLQENRLDLSNELHLRKVVTRLNTLDK